MRKAKADVFLAALVLGAGLCLWTGPAAAGEPADDPASWGAVSAAELEQYRGGTEEEDIDGAAVATASQTGTNTITGAVGGTGSINAPGEAFANQTMSINAFNTGNNVNMQNTMAIMIIIN